MRLGSWFVVALVLVAAPALADKKHAGKKAKAAQKQAEQPPAEQPPAEQPPAEPEIPHLTGPKRVELGNQIDLQLPEGFILFERAQAQELLRKGGNDVDNVLAIVGKPGAEWDVIVEYVDIGYVSDSDADDLQPAELLDAYRKGTERTNLEKRRPLGVPDLFIDGWHEQPRYERAQHHFLWSLDTHDTGGKAVNSFTRILGRGGFISINLIGRPEQLAQARVEAQALLDGITFKPGARYEDYREGDKSSGWGLKALIVGGAGVAVAKKGGLLIAILLGLKKGIVFIAVGIAGFFKWLFGRKKAEPSMPDLPPSDGEPPPTT